MHASFHPKGGLSLRAVGLTVLFFVAVGLCAGCGAALSQSNQYPRNHVSAPMSGYSIGGDLDVTDLAGGLRRQPTGAALVRLMKNSGVQIVRLYCYWGCNMNGLTPEQWRNAFDLLRAAGIKVILRLNGSPHFLRTGIIRNPERYIAGEEAILARLKAAYGGSYPANLVAVDPINEPFVDAQTLPQLRAVTTAIRRYSGLPVSIGGWRTPDGKNGRGVFNSPDPAVVRELAPLVDYLSIHVYPDDGNNVQGKSARTSTDPATYEPFVRNFLRVAVSNDGGKPVFVEEFGGQNGLAPAGNRPLAGSPAHQRAVVDAVLQTMRSFKGRGVTGGTVFNLAHAAPWRNCDGWDLICYRPLRIMPALADLKKFE